jgi:hypothetical protein
MEAMEMKPQNAPALTTADLERVAEARTRLAGIAELLGEDEIAVLEQVAVGLAAGRKVYGELVLATDRRDFRAEAGAELRDAIVYSAAELLRLQRGGTPSSSR